MSSQLFDSGWRPWMLSNVASEITAAMFVVCLIAVLEKKEKEEKEEEQEMS